MPQFFNATNGKRMANIRISIQISEEDYKAVDRLRQKDGSTWPEVWRYVGSAGVETYVTSFEAVQEENSP